MALLASTVSLRSVLTCGGVSGGTGGQQTLPTSGTPSQRRHAPNGVLARTPAHPSVALGSPALCTPGTAGGGGVVSAMVGINDDEAERRQRRLEAQMRTMLSPGCHTPRSTSATGADAERVHAMESGASALSNAQIADHYANCIKLSSENKINAKNAFGLHLIDLMMEMLRKRGEMTNFQVAGCTLDAGAKIYAGRVDSIYNDAYKMLGGLGRGDTQGGGEEAPRDQESASTRTRNKKSTASGCQTVEKDPTSLDVNTFDLEFEVDPLFKKTSAAFDEGNVEGLLLSQIPSRDYTCALMLDAREVPPSTDAPHSPPPHVPLDLWNLLDTDRLKSEHICPTFSSFMFTESNHSGDPWSADNLLSLAREPQNSPTVDQYRPQPDASYSMLQQPHVAGLSDDEDYPGEAEGGWIDGTTVGADVALVEGEACPGGDMTVLGVCGDPEFARVIPADRLGKQPPGGGDGAVMMLGGGDGALCLTEALAPSEYSYFNPAVLSTWAGPQHWKLRPRNTKKEDKGTTAKAAPRKKREPKKQFRIDFSQVPEQTPFTKSRAATTLSKAAVSKLSVSLTTLPRETSTEAQLLFKLFCRPKWRVSRQKKVAGPMDENMDGVWYDYGNANDNANFCPANDEAWRGGEDYSDGEGGGGFREDGGLELSLCQTVVPDFYNQTKGEFLNETHLLPPGDSQEQEQLRLADQLALAGDNLLAQPRRVQQIHIDYARAAKKVDIKKLKSKMWEIISREEGEEANKENQDDNTVDLGLKKTPQSGGTSFNSLCSQLPSRVSTAMAKNVSVSICFVCLLHLANEKDLTITGTEDMTDFVISTSTQS